MLKLRPFGTTLFTPIYKIGDPSFDLRLLLPVLHSFSEGGSLSKGQGERLESWTQRLLLSLLFFQNSILWCENQQVVTFISPRSQSFNAERMLAGWENILHRAEKKDRFNGAFAYTTQAAISFRPERINQCLFGEDIIQCAPSNTEWTDFIVVSGSQTSNRIPQKDWLADYFGLPTDFKSLVRFRPRVNNFIFDFHTYLALNNLLQGLYLRFELPLVYANWDLNMRERIVTKGKNNYAPGYFNATGIDRTNLMSSFSRFISGCSAPQSNDLIFQPLRNAKMSSHSHRLVRCAEFTTTIGYDYFIGTYHHVGCAFQCAAPCGNRPQGSYFFEPIIGNGHHWELGAEITAHCRTWTDPHEDRYTEFFFDATITHLFASRQRRSFDLRYSPNSRYMLVTKMTPPVSDNLTGNNTSADAQYKQEVAPLANITTFDIDVSISAQADIAFMYSYTQRNSTWSIGYSLWKRGCEHIHMRDCTHFPDNTWALKGDAFMFGFIAESSSAADLPVGAAVPLSATQMRATINTGTNYPPTGVSSDVAQRTVQIQTAQRNPKIDNPEPAFAGNNQRLVASLDDTTTVNQINTSIQPRVISLMDIDLNSAATSGFSQKLFTHMSYKIPSEQRSENAYIGLGAEIEFGRQAGPTPAIGTDICINCALSYWGIWLKTGVEF